MIKNQPKGAGIMFGAVFGDIIGSTYEFRFTKEYDFNVKRE